MITIDLADDLNELAYATVCECMAFHRLPFDLDITLEYGDDLPDGMSAACYPMGTGYLIQFNQDAEWNFFDLVGIIGHEMTHVKQFQLEGLTLEVGPDTARYKAQYYRISSLMEYYLAPWEMEARAMEEFTVWLMLQKGWKI
jgi:hypothetical protein